jgi:biotin-(acetyl-CoA carboxylase) ligase
LKRVSIQVSKKEKGAPNDIYIQGKKVCGILIENQTQGTNTRCVIGIGINVFRSPNVPSAGCLNDFRSEGIDLCVWSAFLIELYSHLKESIQYAKKSHLSPVLCNELKKSLLISHPQLDEVLPDGSLKINGKHISWSEL